MLSDVVGRQVKHYRRAAKLTREQVAERCSALGWPAVTSAVVNYIETGRPDAAGKRRREVTLDELVALSYVLEVPPLALLVPLDEERWEGFPGRGRTVAQALAWWRADRPMDPVDARPIEYLFIEFYVLADEAVRRLVALLQEFEPPAERVDAEGVPFTEEVRRSGYERELDAATKHVRDTRRQLRMFGVTPARLPLGLEWVDPDPGGAS